MNLKELNELCIALEDKGLYREADILHEQFIKVSQLDMPVPTDFKSMLDEYASTFLKLCRIAPTKVKNFGLSTYTSDPTASNIKLIQELLLASPYVREEDKIDSKTKKRFVANGIAGPKTLGILGEYKRLTNKILFDAFAQKFNLKDKKGNLLTIENFNLF